MIQGRCLCGKVTFEISDDDLGETRYCHCDNCQRASGSMFSCNAAVPNASFRLKSGEDALKEYESSPGVVRSFCSNCGSPVFAKMARDPGHTRVRLGTLQPHAKVKATADYFVRFKPDWYEITDGLPQHA